MWSDIPSYNVSVSPAIFEMDCKFNKLVKIYLIAMQMCCMALECIKLSKIKVTASAFFSIGSTVPLFMSSLLANGLAGVYMAMFILGKKQFTWNRIMLLDLKRYCWWKQLLLAVELMKCTHNNAQPWSTYNPKSWKLLSQECRDWFEHTDEWLPFHEESAYHVEECCTTLFHA